MKKTAILFTTICLSAFIYVSCSSSDNEIVNQADTTAIGASLVIDAINQMDINTALTVTNTNPAAKQAENIPSTCFSVTIQTPNETAYPKVITVDFGTTGCTINKITRKGQLKITLSAPVITTGSTMTIERIDYYINNLKVEGTIEYTNTTTVATIPQWSKKVINGKLTDLLGRVYTNSGMHITRQTAGVDTPYILEDNTYEITSGSHIVTINGASLTFTVQETLVKKYSCDFISQGKLKVEGGFLNGIIDYGNNTCDSNYTYTHESGVIYNLAM